VLESGWTVVDDPRVRHFHGHRKVFCVAFSVFGLVLAGCASSADDALDRSQFDCPRGLARPFGVEALLRAANQEGVTLKRDPSCGGSQNSIESASNILSGTNDDDGVSGREGHVICDVEDRPFDSGPFKVFRTKYPTDQETYFSVANISCAIYPSSPEQIERLAAAFQRLRVAEVEHRTCPQALPQPVTVDRLIATAKRNGLHLLPDARCIAPGVVAQASTILPYATPGQNEDKVFYDQGEVTCLVRKSALPGGESLKTTTISAGKRFDFLNVSCKIYPVAGDSPASVIERQIERVRTTMTALR
jgi:hypothetical protein